MPSDTPDTLPLERLMQAQQHALYSGRRWHRPDLMFVGSTLTFRPDVMGRVIEEAPILTDHTRLKAAHIRIPEWSHRTAYDWTLQVDMSWISTMSDGLSLFMEFTLYTQGTLDRLLDPDLPFEVAPTMILFPTLCEAAMP